MIRPVEIVTISKIIPIFKDGAEANTICVVNFEFSNGDACGYNVISQKGLYEIGSKAVYIQPDYCLSDLPIFDSFLRPFGDETKSKLGKNFRIRAVKFNFNFEGSTDPIYSFGIMLPLQEVQEFIRYNIDADTLTDVLGITKYEEPESAGSGMSKGSWPVFLYHTDEENINNMKSKVAKLCDGQTQFGLTLKTDGSSHTTYFKKNESGEFYYGICSRNEEKKTEQFYVNKYYDENKNEYHKYIHPETKEKGWFSQATSKFMTEEEMANSGFTCTSVEVKDSWVELATKFGIVERGMKYCKDNDVELAFRGEIYGQGLKGSGNKFNPDAQSKQGLKLFGVDSLETGFSIRQHYGDKHNLRDICEELGFEYTKGWTCVPTSYENLCELCDNIIKEEKQKGRVIEGIVVRTTHSNDISVKYMNPEYDSKK